MSVRLTVAGTRLALSAVLALATPCALAEPADELAAALRARFPALTRVEVTLLPGSAAPAAEVEIPPNLGLDKRVRVWTLTSKGAGKPRRTAQWWTLKAFSPILVARRMLRPGEPVQAADVALEERDIAGAHGGFLDADPGLAAARWRATRLLPQGAPLRRGDLEPAPQVLRGQQVRVRLVSERISIETTGVAREEGRVGRVIAVTRPGTPEPYYAVVTGERQVLVRGKP